ncbi:tyrosine-type recombinase/integrase [Lysinibacillus fusiformis]|uniref:tyrosine-type recombinase/integrase n=1 Tax=Lysinibacillus sp. PWR01 TaxID=3342384 RepID=UPI00372D03AA
MLKQFLEEGLLGKSKTTVSTYSHSLKLFSEWLDGAGASIENYSRSDVQQYVDYLVGRRKSPATINKHWSAIKKYSCWSKNERAIEDISVVKPIEYTKLSPKSLDRIEVNRLIREIDREDNARDMAITQVLLNTGIRLSELVALNKADIDIGERKGELFVRNGKGNKARSIPLNKEARRAINKYLSERNDSIEALFISNRGKRISVRSVQHIFEKKGVNVHALRHTFITHLIRNGIDTSIVQSLSGHSSADMLFRYSVPSEEDKLQALEGIWLTQ